MTVTFDYSDFLKGPSGAHWKKIGLDRRAGVCAPLFSLHSKDSVGIGEFPDLTGFADWCASTGLSIIQLLPLNDVGYEFAPYSAKSCFSLDPMHLSLTRLIGVDAAAFDTEIHELKRGFPINERVNYGIKGAKVGLLWRMFERRQQPDDPRFAEFRNRAAYWLRDDALYKILKSRFHGKGWDEWDAPFRDRDPEALAALAREEAGPLEFQEWLQWQLYEQFVQVKAHAAGRGVLLMGDMPFLVARDSADVWAHPEYFKLELLAGAPPDLYFAGGQRWGMPAYDWPAMAAKGYDYLKEKLRYAENFYDLYRVDHVIGVFRLFTIPAASPADRQGLDGAFDPLDEAVWEEHGRRILTVMLESTRMLPCGEDLGVVPPCSYKVLKEMSIPGLDVQRWLRDWDHTGEFKAPEQYRPHSVAVVSTHDMTNLAAYWLYEAGTVDAYFIQLKCEARGLSYEKVKEALFDPRRSLHGRLRWRSDFRSEESVLAAAHTNRDQGYFLADAFRSTRWEKKLFWKHLGLEGKVAADPTPAFLQKALERAGESASIFSIQLLQDWLGAGQGLGGRDPWDCRINMPGTVGEHNWSWRSPLSVEALQAWEGNPVLHGINRQTGRCA